MGRYVIERLLGAVPLMLLVSMLSFAIMHLAPGDPIAVMYGTDITPDEVADAKAALGLDQPLPVQYVRWLGAVLRGDFGRSYRDGRPALTLITDRIPATVTLSAAALVLATSLGVGVGALAAAKPHSPVDYFGTGLATFFYSVPNFWLGLLLILVFAVWLGVLPSGGMANPRGGSDFFDRLRYLLLPAFVLSLREMGQLIRYTRASVLDVIGQDYVRTARAKGLAERRVVLQHVLRNALLPIITLQGLFFPRLLGGAIIVETVFSWPGMGLLIVESAFNRGYNVLMGAVLLIGSLVVVGNLLADIGYAVADPRVRLSTR